MKQMDNTSRTKLVKLKKKLREVLDGIKSMHLREGIMRERIEKARAKLDEKKRKDPLTKAFIEDREERKLDTDYDPDFD